MGPKDEIDDGRGRENESGAQTDKKESSSRLVMPPMLLRDPQPAGVALSHDAFKSERTKVMPLSGRSFP